MAKKYIDAERLIVEINKHYDDYRAKFHQNGERYYLGLIDGIDMTKRIIDSLQQEQSCDTCTNDKGCVTCKDGELREGKEQPSEELTTEVEKYFQGLWPGMETAEQCNTDMHFTPSAIMRLANHFYELGKKDMKEQMMKDAWEREVKIDSGGYPYIDITAELYDYEHDVPLAKEGELVKIIIVPQKED